MFPGGKTRTAIAALTLAGCLIGLTFLLPVDSKPGAVFFDRGSENYPFTIQNAMWIFFFIGLGELANRLSRIRNNLGGIAAGYLYERHDMFYDVNDLAEVRRKIRGHDDLAARLIDIIATRYQAGQRAVDEAHQMLNSQLEFLLFQMDVDYAMLRYIVWLLPSLGFIGTVLGISNALSAAGAPGAAEKSDFLAVLTGKLALAFDTTLTALLMSSLLLFLMHIIQSREEGSIGRVGGYCLDNLVNKLISNYGGKA